MKRSRSNDRPPGLSRRQFLGALSIPVLAAACGRPPYDPAQFQIPAVSPVGLFPAADYAADFKEIIGRGLRELGVGVRGRRVFLKPNMVEYESNTAINTHPLVVAGAALAFRAAGAADVVVGEDPATAGTWNIWSPRPASTINFGKTGSASSISIRTT